MLNPSIEPSRTTARPNFSSVELNPLVTRPATSGNNVPEAKTIRRAGTRGALGDLYEQELLMLGLYRMRQGGALFSLDTNVAGIGAFDDVVLTCNDHTVYLQAKHAENKKRYISYDNLLGVGAKVDYSLYKYFKSYLKIIQNSDKKDNVTHYFIIYTNIDFKECDKTRARERDRILRKGGAIQSVDQPDFVFKYIDNPPALCRTFLIDVKPEKKWSAIYRLDYEKDQKGALIQFLKRHFQRCFQQDKEKDENRFIPIMADESGLEAAIADYLDRLIFAVHQPNVWELAKQIKEQIKQNLICPLGQEQVQAIYNYVLYKINEWKVRKNKAFPLDEKNNYFKEAEENRNSLYALNLTMGYEKALSLVKMQMDARSELENFLASDHKILHLISETPYLTSVLVYQLLLKSSKAGLDYHLFLSSRQFCQEQPRLLPAWQMAGRDLLILHDQEQGQVNIGQEAWRLFAAQLKTVLDSGDKKKVCVIASSENTWVQDLKQAFPIHCQERTMAVHFSDLTEASQIACLQEPKISLQATTKLFSFNQLLGLYLNETEYLPRVLQAQLEQAKERSQLAQFLETLVIKLDCQQAVLPITLQRLRETLIFCWHDAYILSNDRVDTPTPSLATFLEDIAKEQRDEYPPPYLSEYSSKQREPLPLQSQQRLTMQLRQSLEDIIMSLNHILDTAGLEIFLTESIIDLGAQLSSDQQIQDLARDLYIPRDLYPIRLEKGRVKKWLAQEGVFDFVVFRGVTPLELFMLLGATDKEQANLGKTSFASRDKKEAEQTFKDPKHPRVGGMGVHELIVTEQGELHWLRSEGDIQRLREALCVDDKAKASTTLLSEAELVTTQERVLVLADEPGMGKSTSLKQMGEQLRAKQLMAWVFPIDLNQHQVRLSSEETIKEIRSQIYKVHSVESPYSPTFSGVRLERSSSGLFSQSSWPESFISIDINKKQILDLMVCLLSEIDPTLKKPLVRPFFTYYLNCPGRLVFLLDGFDEIKPERQGCVLQLLQLFRQWTEAKLWITTRQHSQRLLEEGFSVLSYSFRPLMESQQIDFLQQFWCTRLGLSDPQQLIVKAYADEIVRSFGSSIQSVTTAHQESFLRTPLQAYMLAEIFQERVKRALYEVKTNLLQVDESLPIVDIYQQFIDKQYASYLRDKILLNERNLDNESRDCLINAYNKSHGQVALQALFGSDKVASLIAKKKEKFSLSTLWGVGLLRKGEEDHASFIHRTYAEYFVAHYASDRLKKDRELKDFLGSQLFNPECQTIRYFMDGFITKQLPLHRAALLGNENACSHLLQEGSYSDQTDDLGRTSLHLALLAGHEALVEWLYEASNEHHLKPDDFARTPLHYAARYGHATLLERLLCPHIDIDLDDHLFQTPLHVDSEIGPRLFKESVEIQASRFIPLVDAVDIRGYSSLHYAGANGHWDVACVLLLHGADSSVLEEADKKKLFDYAARRTHGRYANQYHPLRPVVGFLATQVPEAVEGYYKNYDYPRLLSYFFAYGHTQVIDTLLASLEPSKRKWVANKEDNSFTPLQRITENYSFRDSDHLKIMQYLFHRGMQQGIEMDPEGTANRVLQVAASCGNLATFRYLIERKGAWVGHWNEANFTIVDKALICRNQLDILVYLWENYREDINDSIGRTPLHIAALSANLRAAQYLCTHGAEINSRDNRGATPLHYAAQAPWVQISPVSRFMGEDHHPLLKYLVSEKKADVTVPDNKGKTALDWAIENQQWHSAAYLIKRYAPLGMGLDARGGRFKAFISIFFRDPSGFDCNLVDKAGLPRLHQAMQSREILWARFLIQQGAFINSRDRSGRTPLHWVTVFQENRDLCKLLLQRGVVYNPCDLFHKTPLDYLRVLANGVSFPPLSSAWLLEQIDKLFHSQNLIQDLQENILHERSGESGLWHPDVYDANNPMILILTVQNRQGKTLLHRAAETEDSKAMRCLLQFNRNYLALKEMDDLNYAYVKDYMAMDLDVQDEEGNTPLHYAAEKGDNEVVDLLLEAGAIFNVKNHADQTPQCLAQENNQDAIVEILKAIADRFVAIKAGSDVVVLMQQASSKAISVRDHKGKTLLHWAAKKGQLKVMQYLLSQQAIEKDALDKQHNTPLHEAVIHHQQEAVFYLLGRGAAFDIRNKQDKTPLDSVQNQKLLKMRVLQAVKQLFADIRTENPRVVLEHLKRLEFCSQEELNAIVHARDGEGNTLLHWAAKKDYLSVVQYLLERGASYDLRNKQKKTPLDLTHHRAVADLLSLVKEWMENKSPFTFRLKEEEMVKEIPPFSVVEVARDPDKIAILKNARDIQGNTLLHGNRNYFRLKFLIAQEMDCTVRNQEGETPLQMATQRGDKKGVSFFKEIIARRTEAEDENKETHEKMACFSYS